MAVVHPLDDVAAHAVDALERAERATVEAHVATCPGCRAQLARHREALSWVVEDERPPPWLWDQIVAEARLLRPPEVPSVRGRAAGRSARTGRPSAVGREPSGDTSVSDRRSAGGPQHAAVRPLRRRSARTVLAGLAAAAAVVVGVAVGPAVLDSLDDGDGDTGVGDTGVVAAEQPVGAITAQDGTTIATVAADDQGSYVTFDSAPELGPDRDYQFWSLAGPAPVSLGVLGDGGRDVRITLPPGTSAVAISDEPAGGSPQPTGPVVGTGELAVPA